MKSETSMSVSEREVYIVVAEVYRFNLVPGYTIGFQRGFHFSKHRQIVPSKEILRPKWTSLLCPTA